MKNAIIKKMENFNNIIISFSGLIIFLLLPPSANAQSHFIRNPTQNTLNILKAAVEAHPDDLKAHEDFINAFDINDPRLPRQYAIWMQRYPKIAMVPFALGKTYEEYDNTICKKYLLKALDLNPNMAEAWEYLSKNATDLSHNAEALEYMYKAAQCDPKNAECAFKYALLNSDGDPAKYDSLMLKVVYHFPDDDRSAEALYRLASLPFNSNEKASYYETLYQLYVKKQPVWFRHGMIDYFVYLLDTSPDKAFELALKMVAQVKINHGDWNLRMKVARDFIEARKLLDLGKPLEAEAIIQHTSLGNSKKDGITIDAEETLALFKAEIAAAANKTRAAYDSISTYYSKLPSDRMRKALLTYASRLGIDSNKADSDIWKVRNANAWSQTKFTLRSFIDSSKVSIADLQGKVVLITYWSPSCGPCRKEFPHIQAVLNKINGSEIVHLGIDVFNEQEPNVMPFVKANHLTFIPLHDDPNTAKGNLPRVTAIPENFLLDQHGRVIFSDFIITGNNERTLELMLTELLKFGKTGLTPLPAILAKN